MRIQQVVLLVALLGFCGSVLAHAGIAVLEVGDVIRVEIDGQLFIEYRFKDVPRPYFYPVIGPTGEAIIRHWPMKEVEHEERDHVHHRSLWFTHGAVNSVDFWLEEGRGGRQPGKIVHYKFLQLASGDELGVIRSVNRWEAADGDVVCTDERTHRFRKAPHGIMMDFEVTVHAPDSDVTFGDTKEGTMAIRLAPTMRLHGDVGQGHILNSEGLKDDQTWGKRAAWCDYYGPVKGKTVGVAIFDHPSNPKHPTWWHVRGYGLFAANPFGVHDFEERPPGTGDITIPKDGSVVFRYRLYFHEGDTQHAQIRKRYNEYAVESR